MIARKGAIVPVPPGQRRIWRALSGLGYQTGRVGVSVGYRFLSFPVQRNVAVFHRD
ncbi:MAG: hypothetical protein QOF70_5322 [Acetobacteraceae bacterium]|jgi:hypothetical protein|nr:hypothetical protein [Acetobacteraceae bacterium]